MAPLLGCYPSALGSSCAFEDRVSVIQAHEETSSHITAWVVYAISTVESQAGFLAGIQCGRRRRCRHYFQGELQLHPISLAPIILVRASPHIAHNGINGIIFSGPAGILAFRASTGSHYFHSPLNRGFHNTGAHAIRIKVI